MTDDKPDTSALDAAAEAYASEQEYDCCGTSDIIIAQEQAYKAGHARAIKEMGAERDEWKRRHTHLAKGCTGKFTLLQGEYLNHQSVQEVANAIAHLLKCGEFYTPDWCAEHFK